MPWLTPSIIATMSGTALLSFVYAYLYIKDRKSYLALWAVSWSVYFIRFIFMLWMVLVGNAPVFLIGNQIASLLSGVILLWGAYRFLDKRFPRAWGVASGLGVLWIIVSVSWPFPFLATSLPTFAFLAFVYIWTGMTFIRSNISGGAESAITGWAFIVWGLHKADYPFLRPVTWLAPFGYLLGALLEFIVAFGMLLVYFQKTRNDLRETEIRNQKMIANIADVIAIVDRGGVTRYVSPNIERWFGWRPEDRIDADSWTSVHPDDLARIQEAFFSLLEKDRSVRTLEYRYNCKDGGYKWIELTALNMTDDPVINGVLVNYRDISERRRAVNALRESEERHRLLFDTADMLISVYDRAGVCRLMNRKTAALFGGAPEEFIGKSFSDLHPEASTEYTKRIRRAIETGDSQEYEDEVRFPRGRRWLLSCVQPLPDAQGVIGAAQIISQDVTERKRAEEALRESEARFSLFMDHLPAVVFIKDEESRTLYVNKFMNDRLGAREWIGKTPHELFPADLAGAMTADDQKAMTADYRKTVETVPDKDGTPHIYETHKFKLPRHGAPPLLGGVAMDVTERKRAEEALQKSEEWLKTILNTVQTGIIVIAAETRKILDVNRAAAKMIGMEKEQIKGLPCTRFFRPFQRGRNSADGFVRMSEHAESRLITADGGEIPVLKTENRTRINEVEYIIESFQDLTEKRQLEERLQQARKMESIGALAGGVAHDFNNILGIVLGNAELAMDDVPEWHPARHNLDAIRTASLRARDVIRQLLSFSRKTEQERRPVTLGSVVKEALKLLRSSIPTMVDIRHDIPAKTSAILADPAQIHQIIINLCTNAAHAMQENGGVLEVGVKHAPLDEDGAALYPDLKPGNYVRLSVSDTGVGIPADIQARIFDPYFTTKEVGKGTGMGLAVVHGIVKNHGGAVSVYSEVGKGSVFRILFPAIEGAPEEKEQAEAAVASGSERILFVDDEPALLSMGKQILERLGYQVETEVDPLAAFEIFRANPHAFDLIITDMTMPGMTGDRLAVKIKALRGDIPVILCTGFSEKINRENAGEMGIDRYVEKPINRREIAGVIREALDGR